MKDIKLSSNKSFGFTFFLVFLFVGLYPLIYDLELRLWLIIISLIFLILGLLNSNILTPFNKLWCKFGIFLGTITSPIIMGLVFFIVVTPIGIIMRFLRKDLLNLKFNQNKTYWIKKAELKSKMKNQF